MQKNPWIQILASPRRRTMALQRDRNHNATRTRCLSRTEESGDGSSRTHEKRPRTQRWGSCWERERARQPLVVVTWTTALSFFVEEEAPRWPWMVVEVAGDEPFFLPLTRVFRFALPRVFRTLLFHFLNRVGPNPVDPIHFFFLFYYLLFFLFCKFFLGP